MTTTTRAVCYARVSSEEQATTGISLAAQETKLRAYCLALDIEVISVEIDAGVSAKSLNRPALQRALTTLRRGDADALVICKLDRLTRSVRDLGTLLDGYFAERFSLLSVGDSIDTRSAAGRLVLNLLTSVAAWEREAGGERVAAVLAHKASRGEYVGGRMPYGFALGDGGVALVEVPGEQEVIREARALHARGMSLRAVAATLAEAGRHARSGRVFAPSAIAAMLVA